ncbi:MAG: alpha/beta fold hydrolase [Proteobacteria bacterium]|nr:alpha/beta fold hydrolase [Pseudomonadota bacterium]HQR03105.1 alpha/beta fold hydrolase [Rhodocyclaceae bacterium]
MSELHHLSTGEGEAVVLIHGFGLDLRVWDDLVPWLAARHRVIRYDLRGFGRSPLPGADYAHADDLAILLDHLGIARAHVLGISMGGWIATHFALTHPQRLNRLVLVSPALIGWEWLPDWKARWSEVKRVAREQGIEAARQQWLAHPLFASLQMQPAARARLAALVADYSGWHWLNAHLDPQQPIAPPDIERLDQIRAPTLVLRGERDLEDFQCCADILTDNIPGARSEVIVGAGHLLDLEQPERFGRIVADFLAR